MPGSQYGISDCMPGSQYAGYDYLSKPKLSRQEFQHVFILRYRPHILLGIKTLQQAAHI